MRLCEFLCVLALSFFLTNDNVLTSCMAASTCPVRAVPVSADEAEGGFTCACKSEFYGTNCRYKGKRFTESTQHGGTRFSARHCTPEMV